MENPKLMQNELLQQLEQDPTNAELHLKDG